MGRSNNILKPFYSRAIKPQGSVALLGFTNNSWFKGDLYDKELNNWDINSNWELSQKYDTIICLRCAYFSRDPYDFISRCHNSLNKDGILYVDWGLGDHWRFKDYKIGWIKDGEQEYAYGEDNFLWSTIWSDEFLEDHQFQLFENRVKKFNYKDVKKSIFKEVPSILHLDKLRKAFHTSYNLLSLWDDFPQLYMLLSLIKL